MLFVFTLSIFVSALLLFLVQPMVAKFTLPSLGGSPAVWNTCMLFFQAALLVGYLYAHLLPKLVKKPKTQVIIHAVMLVAAGLTLPIALPNWTPPTGSQPIGWLLGLLTVMIGGPFFALSTNGPLMQRWFTMTGHRAAKDPYFLYAASNVGSMISLLGYPFLVEGNLTRQQQSLYWTVGYGLFVLLAVSCGVMMMRRVAARQSETQGASEDFGIPPVTWGDRVYWTLLAFVPSSLMLGVTQYLATDIASVPLLWVIPLALYLLTFIIAFSPKLGILGRVATWILPLAAVALAGMMWIGKHYDRWDSLGLEQSLLLIFGVQLGFLFIASLACHGRLAASRPHAAHLTEFFLILALGGVIGGIFNALLAPLVFSTVLEYPIVIVLACLLGFPITYSRRTAAARAGDVPLPPVVRAIPQVVFALAMAGAMVYITRDMNTAGGMRLLGVERTFFGVHRVMQTADGGAHVLMHGSIAHGMQIQGGLNVDGQRIDGRSFPTKYFFRSSPIADAYRPYANAPAGLRVGVVGLGVGTLAMYGRQGWEYDFYEIDPAVVKIANTPEWFSFMERAEAKGIKIKTVLGDARITLRDAPDRQYDILVLDAFSSDSIPMHLITKEAVEMYLSKLKPGGILVFNITNRYVQMRPVLGAIATKLGCVAYSRDDYVLDPNEYRVGKEGSSWLAMGRRVEDMGQIPMISTWQMYTPKATDPLWTDDSANILDVLKWND